MVRWAVLLVGLAAACGDEPVGDPACVSKCNGTCTNVLWDTNNCGVCGTKCTPGTPCNQGKCDGWHPGLTACSGSVVDVQSDSNNCGTCGPKCDTASFSFCTAGECRCATGYTSCSGKCVNLNNDPNNCGNCGTSCGGPCSYGKCVECPGLTVCFDYCVDATGDNNNCGMCGRRCDTANGLACINGKCSCVGSLTECAGKCVETDHDNNNCGVCGKQCSPGEGCVGGVCALPVVALQINCPQTSLPSGSSMQCMATGVLPGGSPVTLTGAVTWSTVNNGACAGAGGTISNGAPGTQPNGTFTAVTAGCMSDVSASYATGGTPIKSNTFTVMVTN